MSKLQWIMLLLGSNLPIGAQLLRNKDTNSTGVDDIGADLLTWTSLVLNALQFGTPIPDLPQSLRDAIDGSSKSNEIIESSTS